MEKTTDEFAPFTDFLSSKDELDALAGPPLPQILAKEIHALDEICRDFIAKSPFCIMATANPAGYVDLSPRGDPPGFVSVISPTLIAVPDRPGNKRMDTFHNLLEDPRVGLLFFVPSRGETLRVRGRGRLCRDADLLEGMAVNGRAPKLALLVHVETAFMHCPKCIMRSRLWQPEKWDDVSGLVDMNSAMVKHAHIHMKPDEWFQHLLKKGEIDLY
ncbi:MAG: MSMEG_1061 family FMN-dependent PPOX-type flavoprotein [Pseudomonadota bacterium]